MDAPAVTYLRYRSLASRSWRKIDAASSVRVRRWQQTASAPAYICLAVTLHQPSNAAARYPFASKSQHICNARGIAKHFLDTLFMTRNCNLDYCFRTKDIPIQLKEKKNMSLSLSHSSVTKLRTTMRQKFSVHASGVYVYNIRSFLPLFAKSDI